MTRSETLAALIAKVEAGTAEGRIGNDVFYLAFPDDFGSAAYDAYHGSLDASVGFVEAVLPGWTWYMSSDGEATVWDERLQGCTSITVCKAAAASPARALLLAALRALAAQEAET